MADDVPRTASWEAEIPIGDCCDDLGQFDIKKPMNVLFNVIPRCTPTEDVLTYMKNHRSLKAWAMCSASHIGTVSTVASRQVSLLLSDDMVAKLLESLKSKPDGFVIYDLSKTELFSNTSMWNTVAANAPEISHKYLYLGLCYNFQVAVEVLEEAIRLNSKKRRRSSFWTTVFAPITLGISLFCTFRESYRLVNKENFPRDISLSHKAYGGIVFDE